LATCVDDVVARPALDAEVSCARAGDQAIRQRDVVAGARQDELLDAGHPLELRRGQRSGRRHLEVVDEWRRGAAGDRVGRLQRRRRQLEDVVIASNAVQIV
jgi:hypothetical protein